MKIVLMLIPECPFIRAFYYFCFFQITIFHNRYFLEKAIGKRKEKLALGLLVILAQLLCRNEDVKRQS